MTKWSEMRRDCDPLLATAAAMVAALCLAGAASAQPPAPTVLDSAARQAIVTQLAQGMRDRYVFPDLGAKAADAITANLKSGAYDGMTEPGQFAARLNVDLRRIAPDKHLGAGVIGVPPPGALPSYAALVRNDGGIVRADRLRGNIGYIELVSFQGLERTNPALDQALGALAGSKALIIDVRRLTVGLPESAAYLTSFLMPPGESVTVSTQVRRTPGTQSFTRQDIESRPTPVSFAGRPVYVLTSAETFSGGEFFVYAVQTRKLGTIVGEVTAGGANPQAPILLGSTLMASIPYGREESPLTKTNWEGKGVQPDIVVPASQALDAVLKRLGQPGARDAASVSEQSVFALRTTPLPGAEAALRRLLDTIAAGTPDVTVVGPGASSRRARCNRLSPSSARPRRCGSTTSWAAAWTSST
jgi:hypothetical protein